MAHRVVSLVPAATEILFALGAGDRLVGRTRWGVHPPEAAQVPDLGDGVRPSLEVVLSRNPDLVVLFEGADTEDAANRLGTLGVPTLQLSHNTISDLLVNVRLLGNAVGCRASADRLVEEIRTGLADVEGLAAGRRPVRVYYDVWPDPPMTVGRGSFLDSLITIAGGRNIFGDLDRPAPEIALEAIVHRDPELVIHPVARGASGVRARPEHRPRWGTIPAVREGRVVEVDADLLGRLGPRLPDAARALVAALHGDSAGSSVVGTGPESDYVTPSRCAR